LEESGAASGFGLSQNETSYTWNDNNDQNKRQLKKACAAVGRNVKNTFYEIHRDFLSLTLSSVVIIFFVPIVFVVTAVFALLLATTLFRFTTFFATVPDRIGDHIETSNWMMWVVTVDHQLTRPGYSLRGLVLNHDIQTGTLPERSRERIVDQSEVPSLPLKPHMTHMQIAITGITDGHRALFTVTALHSAENSGPGNGEPAGRHFAFHRNGMWASRITAADRDVG
jgi:hypothetical protein